MSLAQRIDRPQLQNAEDGPMPAARGAVTVDFRQMTRRQVAAPVAVGPKAQPENGTGLRRESEQAIDLLNEVAMAIPTLMARCQQLEVALADAKEQARSDVEAANDIAREWQQVASAMKVQVEGVERNVKAMKQRAEAAEEALASTREAAERSQHAAAEAECLSSLFQDKLISSFGIGSVMHPILENLRTKPAG